MEVMVLVGLVMYGGYRLIKSATPAARRERSEQKREEEKRKSEQEEARRAHQAWLASLTPEQRVAHEQEAERMAIAQIQYSAYQEYIRHHPEDKDASW